MGRRKLEKKKCKYRNANNDGGNSGGGDANDDE